MAIMVEMLRDWDGPVDARGDSVRYAAGWRGEMPDDAAGYVIAMRIAAPTKPLPPEVEAGIATLREIVAYFRDHERVEPTYSDVYGAVARLAAAQAGGGAQ